MKTDIERQKLVNEAGRLRIELEEAIADGKPFDKDKFARAEHLLTEADAAREKEALRAWVNAPIPGQQPPPSVPTARESLRPNNAIRGNWPQTPEIDAFREYVRTGQVQHDVMQVSISELGGFSVPEEFKQRLIKRLAAVAVVRQAGATVMPTTANQVVWPRLQEHGTSPAIYSSTFVGGWRSEGATLSAIDAKWGQLRIAVHSAAAFAKLTREFVADAAVEVLDVLVDDGGVNLGLVEDLAFLNGGLDPNEPEGLLQDTDITTVDIAGTTANEISNDGVTLGSADKLLDLVAALPAQYRANASWVVHRNEQANIRKLVDKQLRYLWADGLDSQPSTLLGFPVRLSDFMPEGGVSGNKVLLLGDFSHYLIADREETSVQVLMERFADDGQIGLIIWHRVGGGVSDPNAFVIGTV